MAPRREVDVAHYGQPKRAGSKGSPERQRPRAEPARAPEGTPDDAPVEALVRLQVACNQHCFFCNTDGRAENLYAEPAKVRQYIRDNRHALYLSFSGGEPTINPNILKYIGYAHELGVQRVIIQTNAMMASYDAFADKLVAAGLTGAFVSLHAPVPEVSDRITASPGTWKLTTKGLRNLLDRGVECEVNCVINPLNLDVLPDHARFIAERYPDVVAVSLSVVAPTGFCTASEKTIPRIRDVQPKLFEALDVFDAAGICAKVPDRCGLPLCTLRGYEKHSELLMASPFAGTGRVSPDRFKHDGCAACTWDPVCTGYWKANVELYGHEELVPVTEAVAVTPQPLPYKGASAELVEQFLGEETDRLRRGLERA